MVPLFWLLLLAKLPKLALFSGSDRCVIQEINNSQNVSSVLESLQCHNNYMSHVHCKWRQHINTQLELWVDTGSGREVKCEPFDPRDAAKHRDVRCRYKANAFGIGLKHTAFFLQNKTCLSSSSVQHKTLHLLQHLKALPPANLSTHDAADGGRKLIWSSPYPPSSSLNKNLTYQLSYKTHREDNWVTVNVTNTSMTLERQLLRPGHRYEARVRAWASMGLWSDWSPVVTWHTKEDFGQLPTLHCVLDGEKEVTCSWEVSRELAHIITYQLACRHNESAPFERCCLNPAVTSDLTRMMLRYSCTLSVTDPEHLQLNLQPTHSAKSFKLYQNIRPNPPQHVNVTEEDNNWIVKWTEPNKSQKHGLYYQVLYYRKQDENSSTLLEVRDLTSWTILGKCLAPLQDYQVKVRSLVVPGSGSEYKGTPSEWTDPVEWTTNEVWSPTTWIYILITVAVALVFLILYRTIPACRRNVIGWVDSVPSPGKSKILSELMSPGSRTLTQTEKLYICKVQQLDVLSTCSSQASLWPTKDTEKKCLDQDEGCWSCDNLPSPTEEVNVSDTSAISFTGPYILCRSPEPAPESVSVKDEEMDTEAPSDGSASPSPVNFTLFGEGYVCLPRHSNSRSTQDLMSHCDENTSTHWCDSAEQDQRCNDPTPWLVNSDIKPGFSEPTVGGKPPEYTPGPFTHWPEGATVQASGYCHLPTAFMQEQRASLHNS
ncbi:cytokine receptor common subunit beta [Haplochromis burtoni]|uniref:Cytokine receptor common subunit beta-like n=1 Tax=Haplochromis burtoni TaxID=8153 RepID=A0A3Q2XGR1_HAPBU|nr:cytokine receptor common subunit beta [Haplochromis burtoni]XP_005949386.1 cytokine receptor common subunit beta [Haplochromis burtoni]XP_014185449.1 cytokine receptor common subunit beta [Haplochromis burtoni]